MASTNELVALLHEVLRDRFRRKELIFRFQELVNNPPASEQEGQEAEVLGDLAWDLSFYVQSSRSRREDPAYYGDDRLEEEIRAALRKLGREEDAEGP